MCGGGGGGGGDGGGEGSLLFFSAVVIAVGFVVVFCLAIVLFGYCSVWLLFCLFVCCCFVLNCIVIWANAAGCSATQTL